MRYEINSGALNVVFDTVDLNAVIGNAAQIDVGEAINYIKSGEAEIAAYVNNTAKPTIDSYVIGTAEPTIDSYVTNTVIPQFSTYIDLAKDWATKTDGTVDGSEYSAKYYANQAAALFVTLAPVATSGSYNDLTDKPVIPTKTSDLTNDSGYITSSALSGYATQTWVSNQGYITGITSADVTTALGYTPYDSSNPSGYTSNVGTVTSVNNVSPVNGDVTLAIPTVNNATLTITQGGVSKGTFTANASSDVTIALDAGGGSSYTAGTGIDITSDVISIDNTVATKTYVDTGLATKSTVTLKDWTV